jgi:chromosome segregation ATPase
MDRPKITDKVRFWEEQDKINQALIPRMLEMHEIVKKSALLTQQNSSDIVSLSAKVKNSEARLLEMQESVKTASHLTQKNSADLVSLSEKVKNVEARLLEVQESVQTASHLTQKNSADLASLSEKVKNVERRLNLIDTSGKAKLNVWNIVSLALGVVAVVLALLK